MKGYVPSSQSDILRLRGSDGSRTWELLPLFLSPSHCVNDQSDSQSRPIDRSKIHVEGDTTVDEIDPRTRQGQRQKERERGFELMRCGGGRR